MQLPDVVERFVADVLPYIRDLERAAREADEFGDENRRAAQEAHMFGQQAEEAGRRAARAQTEANEAAERAANGQGSAAEAARLARIATEEHERAQRLHTQATEASDRAERSLENQHRALAREARAAANAHRASMGQMSGDMREHDRVVRETRDSFGGFGRDGDRAMGMVRDAGKETGGILSSIGSSLMSNWMTAIAVLVAGLAGLPAIAVAVGGALTLALGGGIAALGIMAAAQNKKVKSAFGGLAGHVKKVMADISKPFQGTLIKLAGFMKRTFDSFAPLLRNAFKDMAPVLTVFFDQLFKAFEQLKPVIPTVTAAFISLIQAIGPRLPEIMKNIADAIVMIVNEVGQNPDLFVAMIVGFSQLIQWGGTLIVKLMQLYHWFSQQKDAIGFVKGALGMLGSTIPYIVNLFRLLIVWLNYGIGKWKGIIAAVKDFAGQIPKLVSAAWNRAKQAHVAAGNWLINTTRSLPGRIKNSLGSLDGLLWMAGWGLIKGLLNGIRAGIGPLMDLLGWITSKLPGWKGPLDKDKRILTPAGREIMGGLMRGIVSQLPALKSTLGAVTGAIALPGVGMGGLAVAGAGGRGEQAPVNVYVAGSVVSERQLIEVVRAGLSGRTVANPGNPGTSSGRRV